MTFQDYLDEIQKCIDNKCFIASLTMALLIPDICGKVVHPEYSKCEKVYKMWYSKYMGNEIASSLDVNRETPWISEDVAYSLRCQMLHDAAPNIEKSKIRQAENQIDKICVMFSDSSVLFSSGTYHTVLGKEERKMTINAKSLSEQLLNCGREFYKGHKEEMDKKYLTIKDGFGDKYLWTK